MPKAARKSSHVDNTSKNEADSNLSHESSSDDEVVLQSPQFKPSTSQTQAMQQMYMPFIEGPKMDWTVNDTLYHTFLKWKIKCKNILDCELAMISKQENVRKLWPGQMILELTSMYHGACPKMNSAWR